MANLTPDEQITELQSEIAELRGRLKRKGKAGRPAICLCGHKRHAAQCQECKCAEYIFAKTTNAERCKRYRVKKENNSLHR